jgi:hypothetical protein
MNSGKQVICSERVRQVPAQFSWVDQRLVRDRHLDGLDVYAAALYLLLITVADSRGLSWYGDTSAARRLSMDEVRLRQARGDLARAGLIAHRDGLYQVLSLDNPPPAPVSPSPASPAAGRAEVQKHLARLHAAIRRQP